MNDNEKDLVKIGETENKPQEIKKVQPIEQIDSAKNSKESDKKVQATNEPKEDTLFGDYEVRNWDYSGRIYKILAIAAIFNLLALFIFAQTNILSKSACDNPFVGSVCQVLDTVYVGSKLYSGDNEFGREEFTETVINGEDVVWVDEGIITPPISYPEGYFELANRDELAAMREREAALDQSGFSNGNSSTYNGSSSGGMPPFTPSPKPPRGSSSSGFGGGRRSSKSRRRGSDNVLDQKQVLPKTRKKPTTGKVNKSLFDIEDGDENSDQKTAKSEGKKSPEKAAIAEKTAKNSNAVEDIDVNKLPFEKFLIPILEKQPENELELKKQFSVTLTGQLNEDGTFNPEKTRYTQEQGEDAIKNIVKGGIEALGDSKFLTYLTRLDVKKIRLTVGQDGEKFQALIVSGQNSPQSAKQIASGLNGAIALAKHLKKQEINGGEKDPVKIQNEKDQLFILEHTKVVSQDNNFILKIDIPRDEIQQIIKRNLDAQAEKRKKTKTTANPTATNQIAQQKLPNWKTIKLNDEWS